jgi:hypothetical protein
MHCKGFTADWLLQVQAAGLHPLVEYSKKKVAEVHVEELKTALVDAVTSDPPLPVSEVVAMVKAKKAECQLPDTDIIKVPMTHFL